MPEPDHLASTIINMDRLRWQITELRSQGYFVVVSPTGAQLLLPRLYTGANGKAHCQCRR